MAAKKLGRPSNESKRLAELEELYAGECKHSKNLEESNVRLKEELKEAKIRLDNAQRAWATDNGHADGDITKLATDLREAHRYIGELTVERLRINNNTNGPNPD